MTSSSSSTITAGSGGDESAVTAEYVAQAQEVCRETYQALLSSTWAASVSVFAHNMLQAFPPWLFYEDYLSKLPVRVYGVYESMDPRAPFTRLHAVAARSSSVILLDRGVEGNEIRRVPQWSPEQLATIRSLAPVYRHAFERPEGFLTFNKLHRQAVAAAAGDRAV